MKTEILITQDTRKGTTLIERFHMSLLLNICTQAACLLHQLNLRRVNLSDAYFSRKQFYLVRI